MPNQRTLNETLPEYFHQREGRYAEGTWRNHVNLLERFRTWASRPTELGPNCLLMDIDERVMVRYFNRYRNGAVAGSTFNNYRQYMRLFFNFCRDEGWINSDPMRHVDTAPVVRKPRLQLSARELEMILEGAEPRDRYALALGENTVLRVGDVVRLKIGQVNLSNNYIEDVFVRKTNTYDRVPMTAELRVETLRWFAHYAETMGLADYRELNNDWWLVPALRYQMTNVWHPELGGTYTYRVTSEKPMTGAGQIVHRALERLGYPTAKEGFHTLRRSGSRILFDMAVQDNVGDPIRMAQAFLGHSNQATTERYLGLTYEKQKRDEMLRGQSFIGRMANVERQQAAESEQKGQRSA